MKPRQPEGEDSTAEQAVMWFLQHREGPLDAAQKARFLAWMQRSPEHVRAYLRALNLHRQVGAAMAPQVTGQPARQLPAEVVPLFTVAARQRTPARPRRRAAWRRLATAACLLVLLGGVAVHGWPLPQRFDAGHGQLRDITLADGSTLRLNADSAVQVRLGWFERRVELLHGEASFDVAVDRRPFEVRVADLRIRDIGTVFDVARRLQGTRIGVVSGEVEVWSTGAGTQRLAQLDAGRVVLVVDAGHRVQALDMPASMLLDWQQRKVSFLDERLDEVAAAFNRHNQVQVHVTDAHAAALRLSGSLDAHRIGALQAFLARDPRFRVERDGDTVRVGSR